MSTVEIVEQNEMITKFAYLPKLIGNVVRGVECTCTAYRQHSQTHTERYVLKQTRHGHNFCCCDSAMG